MSKPELETATAKAQRPNKRMWKNQPHTYTHLTQKAKSRGVQNQVWPWRQAQGVDFNSSVSRELC